MGKGYSIGFTGPDGVGKTTVINEIEAFLRTVYSNTQLYHFRPSMFGNLSDVAHSAGIKKQWIGIILNHTVVIKLQNSVHS